MKWLAKEGAGFDCASGMELMSAAKVYYYNKDFTSNSIFANPCKPLRDLKTALDVKCGPTVVDSVEELEKCKEVGWDKGVLIRLAVDDKGSRMPFSRKFGANLEDIPKLKEAAVATGQEVCGISFHVGSGCIDVVQYDNAIKKSLNAMKHFKKAGILDIGGGFDSSTQHFLNAAMVIQTSLKINTADKKLKVIAEPGRYFGTDFQDLFVPVIGKKPTADGKGWRYTIDESLYGQFSCIPFDRAQPTWMRIRMSETESIRKRVSGTLFGRTCDSVDMIAQSESMEELEVGDWLWFPHMGAYTSVTATEFNGFPKPKLHYIEANLPNPSFMEKDVWPTKISRVSSVLVPEK
jgi:ornithine decarboxylase